jgi:hypothetical protein
MASRQLWIFRVSGGEPFRLDPKGNPPMVHDGGAEALLKCLCTEEQADELEAEMVRHGCTVSKNCPAETKEQKEERKNIMQVLGGERSFPCARCPECAWFDPHLESLCGAGLAFGKPGWDDAAVQGSMTSDKFRADFEACPLREGQIQ